jgi:hypothetical protein
VPLRVPTEEASHCHGCIAGQGHLLASALAGSPVRARRLANVTNRIGELIDLRVARLKPEFAPTYPAIRPSVWYLAAAVVSAIWHDEVRGQGRRLSDEHFEFRGGTEERRPGTDTRSSDRTPHDLR